MLEDRLYKNLYNPDIKKKFLEEYGNIDTQTTYSFVLGKIKETEEHYNKDLYEMNINQIEEALRVLRPSTISAARSYGRIATAYISWAIGEGELTTNINPLKMVNNSFFIRLVDTTKKLYVSLDELEDYEKDLVNAQDAIIPRLLFEGVNGYGGSEILNLKQEDVDFDNNTLALTDDKKGERKLEVSRECIALIRDAINDKVYRKENGDSDARNPIVPLVENKYIVRNAGTRVENFQKADKHTIYRRLAHVSSPDLFNIPHFNSKNIQRSGMIYMARNIYIRDNNTDELTNEQLKEIAEKFNLSMLNINGNEVYNFSAMREYINLDNMRKLYDI